MLCVKLTSEKSKIQQHLVMALTGNDVGRGVAYERIPDTENVNTSMTSYGYRKFIAGIVIISISHDISPLF